LVLLVLEGLGRHGATEPLTQVAEAVAATTIAQEERGVPGVEELAAGTKQRQQAALQTLVAGVAALAMSTDQILAVLAS